MSDVPLAPRKKMPLRIPLRPTGNVKRQLFPKLSTSRYPEIYTDEEEQGNIIPTFQLDIPKKPRYAFYHGMTQSDSQNSFYIFQNFLEALFTWSQDTFVNNIYYKKRFFLWDEEQHKQYNFSQYLIRKRHFYTNEFFWFLKKGVCMIDLCSLTKRCGYQKRLLKSLVRGHNSSIALGMSGNTCRDLQDDILDERNVWSIQCFAGENGKEATDIITMYNKFYARWTSPSYEDHEQLRVKIKHDRITAGDEFCLTFRTVFNPIENANQKIENEIFHAIVIPTRLLLHCNLL